MVGRPVKCPCAAQAPLRLPPLLGQPTRAILAAKTGYTGDEIDALFASGAVGRPPLAEAARSVQTATGFRRPREGAGRGDGADRFLEIPRMRGLAGGLHAPDMHRQARLAVRLHRSVVDVEIVHRKCSYLRRAHGGAACTMVGGAPMRAANRSVQARVFGARCLYQLPRCLTHVGDSATRW